MALNETYLMFFFSSLNKTMAGVFKTFSSSQLYSFARKEYIVIIMGR